MFLQYILLGEVMFLSKTDELRLTLKNYEEDFELEGQFKYKFLAFIEKLIIEMLDGEDNFFGYFILNVKRDINYKIKWPIVTYVNENGFYMDFNPRLFLNYDDKEMVSLLKHEIYHIMYNHYEREKNLRIKYSKEAVNIALDISINQYINNLPMDAITLERVKRELNISLKEYDTCENYAEKIDKVINEKVKINSDMNNSIGKVLDVTKAHETWSEIEVSKEYINQIVKKTAISAFKIDAPKGIKKIINQYKECGDIPWQQVLKRAIKNSINGKRKTIVRRSRRQPERLELKGEFKNKVPEIIIAIDISASVSPEYYKKIMIELLNLMDSKIKSILIIECDNEVRRVYNLKSKNDLKDRYKKTGATLFTPVFKYIKENKLENRMLIYFTDGIGEKEIKENINLKELIWVIIGNEDLSLRRELGKIVRINQ